MKNHKLSFHFRQKLLLISLVFSFGIFSLLFLFIQQKHEYIRILEEESRGISYYQKMRRFIETTEIRGHQIKLLPQRQKETKKIYSRNKKSPPRIGEDLETKIKNAPHFLIASDSTLNHLIDVITVTSLEIENLLIEIEHTLEYMYAADQFIQGEANADLATTSIKSIRDIMQKGIEELAQNHVWKDLFPRSTIETLFKNSNDSLISFIEYAEKLLVQTNPLELSQMQENNGLYLDAMQSLFYLNDTLFTDAISFIDSKKEYSEQQINNSIFISIFITLLGLILIFFLNREVQAPLKAILECMYAVQRKDFTFRVRFSRKGLLGALISNCNSMMTFIEKTMKEREKVALTIQSSTQELKNSIEEQEKEFHRERAIAQEIAYKVEQLLPYAKNILEAIKASLNQIREQKTLQESTYNAIEKSIIDTNTIDHDSHAVRMLLEELIMRTHGIEATAHKIREHIPETASEEFTLLLNDLEKATLEMSAPLISSKSIIEACINTVREETKKMHALETLSDHMHTEILTIENTLFVTQEKISEELQGVLGMNDSVVSLQESILQTTDRLKELYNLLHVLAKSSEMFISKH